MKSAWTLLEHPFISNDARTGWSNQFPSSVSLKQNPVFSTGFVVRESIWQNMSWNMKVLFYLPLIMLHKLLKEITFKTILFSGFWSWILGRCCSIKLIWLLSSKTTVTLWLTHIGCLKLYAFPWGFPWFISISLFSKLKILHLTDFCRSRKVEKQQFISMWALSTWMKRKVLFFEPRSGFCWQKPFLHFQAPK